MSSANVNIFEGTIWNLPEILGKQKLFTNLTFGLKVRTTVF